MYLKIHSMKVITMHYEENYYKQSALMVKILPFLNETPCFALKGGTAINYFYQNMPRLSVDIDLAYLPLKPREQALAEIKQAMIQLVKQIQQELPTLKVMIDKSESTTLPKLQVQEQGALIKIEINPVFRGSVFDSPLKPLCEKAQSLFNTFIEIKTTSFADLYAGKFCAALTRQHPRDLFDVKLFLEQSNITDNIRQAFVIYLASDRRPLHEILNPNIKPAALQQQLFSSEFLGMVDEPLQYKDLAPIVGDLATQIRRSLTNNEKEFLLSIAAGQPAWEKMPFGHLKELPALQWKLFNVKKMDTYKQQQAYLALATLFERDAAN